jgi:hypothetical protein
MPKQYGTMGDLHNMEENNMEDNENTCWVGMEEKDN